MSNNSYIQRQASTTRARQPQIVKQASQRVESSDLLYQARRNAIAMMRAFAEAYPAEATEIVREVCNVKI